MKNRIFYAVTLLVILTAFSMVSVAETAAQAERPIPIEITNPVIAQAYTAFRTMEFDNVEDFISDDFSMHLAVGEAEFEGTYGFIRLAQKLKAFIPDCQMNVVAELEEGDMNLTQWQLCGTPVGREETFETCGVWLVSFDADGKIAQTWLYMNVASLAEVIGSPLRKGSVRPEALADAPAVEIHNTTVATAYAAMNDHTYSNSASFISDEFCICFSDGTTDYFDEAGFGGWVQDVTATIPDWQLTVIAEIEGENLNATHWVLRGTPEGRDDEMFVSGIWLVSFDEDGKIARTWDYFDLWAWESQIEA